jgi:hypothetical protein
MEIKPEQALAALVEELNKGHYSTMSRIGIACALERLEKLVADSEKAPEAPPTPDVEKSA